MIFPAGVLWKVTPFKVHKKIFTSVPKCTATEGDSYNEGFRDYYGKEGTPETKIWSDTSPKFFFYLSIKTL